MASKFRLITELYEYTAKKVCESPAAWTAFLRSACRNYKCRFDEQILIYAQRPNARAVLEIEKWNGQFGRWVNKGATGIAVFNETRSSIYPLKHYFDISDTHGSRFERPVPIWSMQSEYEPEVMESLENSFGEFADKADLADALFSAADNSVRDNYSDYFHALKNIRDGSFLEELDEFNVEVEFRDLLKSSVAYMLLTRCGIDSDEYFDFEDFQNITSFNTTKTLNALGIAASDISELILREISATVLNLQNREKAQNRTFAKKDELTHNITTTRKNERSFDNGTDIPDGGGLSNTQSDNAGRIGSNSWQIRVDAREASEKAQPGAVHKPVDSRETGHVSGRDRTVGDRDDETIGPTDGGNTGGDGKTQSDRPDPSLSGGNYTQGTDTRIKPLPTVEQQLEMLGETSSILPNVPQNVVDEALTQECRDSSITQLKFRIYYKYKQLNSDYEFVKFLKNEFGFSGRPSLEDGSFYLSYSAKGITFTRGDTLYPDIKTTLSWEKAAKRVIELINTGKLISQHEMETMYPKYLEYLENQEILRKKKQFIDSVAELPPEEKRDSFPLRLADFTNCLPHIDREYLVKNGLSEMVDTVSPTQIEALLASPQKIEQLRIAFGKIKGGTTDIFVRNNAWHFGHELEALQQRRHVIRVGSTVYIGAQKYNVLALDEKMVLLSDPEFPIEILEMGRVGFDSKLSENSLNDGLLETVLPDSEVKKKAATPPTIIADFVMSKLKAGEKFSSTELFAEATKAYGDTMANNAFTSKDAYDAMELGVNQYILSSDNVSPEKMLSILGLLPTQTRRTTEMEQFQQFSTPPSIAYLANWAANVNSSDIMLEPSAGIGGIAIFAKKDGAKVYVNELDKRRLEILRNLPFDGFYNEDAEQINNILGDKIQPTVIVMNPPFSLSAARNMYNTNIGAKHIEKSLKMLAPNGRLVAIVGQGMAEDAPVFRSWWRSIKEQYNVKANIGVDGKNYSKYGTTFGIQILVIDKTGATIEPVKTAFVENLNDLQNILGGIRDDRPSIQLENDSGTERNTTTTTRTAVATERQPEREPSNIVSDTGDRADTATIGDRPRQAVTSEVDRVVGGTSDIAPEPANVGDNGLTPIVNRERDRGNDRGNDVADGTGRTGAVNSGQSVRSVEPLIKSVKPVKTELTDSIFESYEPQPLLLENVQPHPANISESAAMSAIQPPPVTYKPNLNQEIIDNGILSDVQLEAVTYAGQSHSQTLPCGNTRGFFLGDGTGVGKGRTITGIILDNYRQGRKKALWLSENTGLVPDAKRDVRALFGTSDLVTEFKGGKKADASLCSDEAILFATYSALSKGFDQSESNFEKIVNWLGKDFDGVIVFDEAHNMANSIATKGTRGVKKASQRGVAGLAIQEALPKAKIVYSSATGATEVENLRYAERLGLWGEGTAFPNGDDFVHKVKAGGLAAMELIARDMKAMGVYLSRNISYEDVVYDKIVHELTPNQRQIYDELARSWQIVLQNMNQALKVTKQNLDGMAKGKAYGAFWGTEQRFFNQILTAMQVPSMITDIQKQLDSGNSIVIQLVSTNESAQEREFVRLQEQGLELEDFDLTPKQMLMSYIENSFPTIQFEEYKDDNGNVKSKPVYDSEGNVVINREAVKQKEMLLDKLGSIKVPASALDMIINHFGSDMVAENTGRKRRVVVKDGKAKEENIANKKEADVSAFQNGDKRIIIFSKAGGTGKSYHADKAAKNQQHRVHYLLQAGWRADAAVQGFGRSHRSNQVSAPTFVLVTTDLKGQTRFISTIAKRLDQLGALTKGQRQTGSQGMFTAKDNLENAFAADVLASYYKTLIKNHVGGISDGVAVIEKLGLKDRLLDEYGHININANELREVNKFLNRILSLECYEQNIVFDGYAERLHIATEKAIQEGTLDTGLENYKADRVVLKETHDVRVDENTGATTKYYSLAAHSKIKPVRFSDVNTSSLAFIGFYQSKNTGAVRAAFTTSSVTNEYGDVSDNCRLTGQDGNEYIPRNRLMNNWEQLNTQEAEKLWNNAVLKLPEFRITNLHLIGGAVLPIWDKLPAENVRIYRVLTTDGDMLIGRVIPEDMIDITLRRLETARTKENLNAEDLIKCIKIGDTVYLDNGWRIAQRKVSSEQRIEVIGANYHHSQLLLKKGVFTERINFDTRYFIPSEKDTHEILNEIIKISPVSRIEDSKEHIAAKPGEMVRHRRKQEMVR